MSIDSSTEKTSFFFFPLFFTLGLGKGIFESRRQQRIKPNTPVINGQILISIIKANSNRIIAEYGLFTEETEQEYRHLRPSTLSLVQCRQGRGTLLRLSKSPWDLFLPVYVCQEKAVLGRRGNTLKHFSPQIISVISFCRSVVMKISPNILPKWRCLASRGAELPQGEAEQDPSVHGHKNKCPIVKIF